jgi:UDP-2-acetamido-3-amino-2,3-dideoxy-glucuronate N-acetyltransferase
VSSGARIGRGCVLGQNVYVASSVQVGNDVRVQNNVSLYDGVTLEDHVFVGPSAVFTNVVRPRAEVSRKDEYAPTRVGRGATIGANATLVCGVTLGAYAFIGAGAVVTRDVPSYALVVGNPAHRVGWACRCGERLPDGDARIGASTTSFTRPDPCAFRSLTLRRNIARTKPTSTAPSRACSGAAATCSAKRSRSSSAISDAMSVGRTQSA